MSVNILRNRVNLRKTFASFMTLYNSSDSPFISYNKIPRYNDEPLLYQYAVRSKTHRSEFKNEPLWGTGTSFSKEVALVKAFGEGLERYATGVYEDNQLSYGSLDQFSKLGIRCMDITKIKTFSDKQRDNKKFNKFEVTSDKKYFWTKGYSIFDEKQVLVPAQLVYVPYFYNKDESVIQFPVTTGTALSMSKKNALYRAICELIERDSYMIFYLNKLKPKRINIQKSAPVLKKIHSYFSRYKLELLLFDITSDINVSVIMAIIIDKTSIGPAISVGLKCSLSIKDAVIGAIEEAQQIRPWMRDEYIKAKSSITYKLPSEPDDIVDPLTRGLYWYTGANLHTLDFLLKDPLPEKSIYFNKTEKISEQKELTKLLIRMKSMKINIFIVDLTPTNIKKYGFHIFKAISSDLQPLYLDERYPYLGNDRLISVPNNLEDGMNTTSGEFNSIPHPFL